MAFRFAILIVLLTSILVASRSRNRFQGADFVQYWTVAQIFKEEPETHFYLEAEADRWTKEMQKRAFQSGSPLFISSATNWRRMQFTSTPLLYQSLAVFNSGNFQRDHLVFNWSRLFLFVLSAVLITAAFKGSLERGMLFTSFILVAYPPLHADLAIGNANQFQLVGLAIIAFMARSRAFWPVAAAGAVFSIETAFKPTFVYVPLILLMHWIWTRQWKLLVWWTAGTLTGAAAVMALAFLRFHSLEHWSDWFTVGYPSLFQYDNFTIHLSNLAPTQVLHELAGWRSKWIQMVLHFLWFAACLWVVRRTRNQESRELQPVLVALGGAFIPLLPFLAWSHYQVLFIPIFYFLFFRRPGGAAAVFAGISAVLLLIDPWLWFDASPVFPAIANLTGSLALLISVFYAISKPRYSKPS